MNMRNKFDENYRQITPPSGGLRGTTANKMKVCISSGKMSVTCEQCHTQYENYACYVRRNKHNYCSKACRIESQKRPVNRACVECGKIYTVKQSNWGKIITCSPECRAVRMSRFFKVFTPTRKRDPKTAQFLCK